MNNLFGKMMMTAAAVAILGVSPAAAQKPTPIRDVDRPASQPFQFTCLASIASGHENNSGADCQFTVPAGKRLVVEMLSFHDYTLAGQAQQLRYNMALVGGTVGLSAMPSYDGVNNSGNDLWVGTHSIRVYFEPSALVSLALLRAKGMNTFSGQAYGTFLVAGHLVDIQ